MQSICPPAGFGAIMPHQKRHVRNEDRRTRPGRHCRCLVKGTQYVVIMLNMRRIRCIVVTAILCAQEESGKCWPLFLGSVNLHVDGRTDCGEIGFGFRVLPMLKIPFNSGHRQKVWSSWIAICIQTRLDLRKPHALLTSVS